jgi:hypothetical protein
MTARRLRESPRMIAAGALSAVVLVLIGVLIGAATAGGSSGTGASSDPAAAALRHRDASQAAELESARQMITGLRAQRAAATQSLETIRTQLGTARARARCWKEAALHHAAGGVPKCAART